MDSVWAEEGTLFHEIAEYGWRCALHLLDSKQQMTEEQKLRDACDKAGAVASDLFAAAALWRNHVRDVHDEYFTDWLYAKPEVAIDLSDLYPTMRGKADFAGVWSEGSQLHVLISDLKAGTGVPVKAFDNGQLKLYAWGFLQDLEMLYDLDDETPVHLQIAQVRVEDGVSTWVTTKGDLDSWVDDVIRPAIHKAITDPVGTPGKWCQFCNAGGVCKVRAAVASEALNLAEVELNADEIAEWLDKAPIVQGFLKRVRERAENDIRAGRVIPGWTLKRSNGNRQIVDVQAATEALIAEGFRQSEFSKPRELLGVTALDGLVGGKKKLAEILGDALGQKQGTIKLTRGEDGLEELARAAFPDDPLIEE